MEFPAIDPRLVGQQTKFAYGITPRTAGAGPGGLPNRFGPPGEGILIDGVAKFDLTTGEQVASWTTDAGYWITSEPTFVPKLGSTAGDGDAGYIFVFCTAVEPADGTPLTGAERGDGRASRLIVLDAKSMDAATILDLPGAVPYGLHSTWVPYDDLSDPSDDAGVGTPAKDATAPVSLDVVRFAFEAFDADRDGRLTADELTLATRALGRPLSEEVVAKIAASVERAEGGIEFGEWERVLSEAGLVT